MPELTPVLKQYFDIKEKHKDCILLFRIGDFYEMFGDDAIEASKILEIVLTARGKGASHETPMCGVPHHALANYLPKLIKAGKKAAICEQVSDPSLPGIVQREVVRIVTPGTTFEDNTLEQKNNNYIVSIYQQKNIFGLAFCDLTTGEFKVCEISNKNELLNELTRLNPAEIILPQKLFNNENYSKIWQSFKNVNVYQISVWQKAYEIITKHFQVKNLAGFGIENLTSGIEAAGLLLNYLQETQKTNLSHLNKISFYDSKKCMVLDEATIRNLDLLYNSSDFSKQASLLGVLDETITAMAGRLLRNWVLHPLLDKEKIENRLNIVEEFYKNTEDLKNLRENLKKVLDIERLIAKIGCNRATARDLIGLKNSLTAIFDIKQILSKFSAESILKFKSNLDEHKNVVEIIEQSIVDEPPHLITEGGMIKRGYDKELDDLWQIAHSGKDYIRQMQANEIKKTGINSLKIKYNKVFGYYIEISNANLSLVPQDYIRKQTLVNAERFITPELKEYEEKVLGAEDKIKQIELRIFNELRLKISQYFFEMQKTAKFVAILDVLSSFAFIALQNNYSQPKILLEQNLKIKNARHPVIEKINRTEQYVPNDLLMADGEIILLTGPNMSGKSSFLRQTALIVLMAHIGSFVPAESAEIGLTDRIFTRVGASDNLIKGQSTFMVEMQEAANILNNATAKSLLVIDELGRGTSTYDGVSIAWSIIEHIHNKIAAKTLFATHYHELIEVIEKLDKAQNYSIAVTEDQGKVVFLRKVVKGAVNKSYGVEVAKLAGLPKDLISRAEEILLNLEKERSVAVYRNPAQDSLFSLAKPRESEVEKIIKNIDLNGVTPLEALNLLAEMKRKIDD